MTGADMLIQQGREAQRGDILLVRGASILLLLSGCGATRPSSETPVTGLQALLDDPAPMVSAAAQARRRSFDTVHDRVLCGGKCPSSSELGLGTAPGPDYELVLGRSCPAYEVTLRGDGTVVYQGHRRVKVLGRVLDHVAPRDVDGLARRFEDGYEKVHQRDVWWGHLQQPDVVPDLTITLVRGDRRLRVERDVLGVAAEIDRIVGTERWTRCGQAPDAPCEEPAATGPAPLSGGTCVRAGSAPRR